MPQFRFKNPPIIKQRYVPKAIKHEQSLQQQVCHWLRLNYPNVIFRSDYASGLYLTPHQAKTHASLQSGRSWPDLFIYTARRGYHGLALELKKDGTKITTKKGLLVADPHIREQHMLLLALRKEGYYTNFGIGFEDTIETILWYFEVPKIERQKLF